jgi:hypothetical protein
MSKLFVPFFTILIVATFGSCGAWQKKNASDAADNSEKTEQNEAFAIERLSFIAPTDSNQIVSRITIDWPTNDGALADGVRQHINTMLAQLVPPLVSDEQPTQRYTGNLRDANAMMTFYANISADYLQNEIDEMRAMELPVDEPLACEIKILKTDESAHYITYTANVYAYLGGAHPSSHGSTANISKLTNSALTLTIDTARTAELQPILRQGVLHYLYECGDSTATLQTLDDYLLLDGAPIPVPAFAPYLASDGVHFVYQQYEIAPYAMGMPAFVVDYETIRPYLTSEARKLAVD